MTDEQRKSVALEYLKAFDNKGVTSIGVLAAGVRPNIVPCKWLCRVQGLILSKAEGITLFSFPDSALSRWHSLRFNLTNRKECIYE